MPLGNPLLSLLGQLVNGCEAVLLGNGLAHACPAHIVGAGATVQIAVIRLMLG